MTMCMVDRDSGHNFASSDLYSVGHAPHLRSLSAMARARARVRGTINKSR